MKHRITSETFGLSEFDNDHLLHISKVPAMFCWNFLAGLAAVIVSELLKLSLIYKEVQLLLNKYRFNYKC